MPQSDGRRQPQEATWQAGTNSHLAEWTRIAPLLAARETRGTYYADHRRVLNGMLYRHATGWAWRDLPPRYGP